MWSQLDYDDFLQFFVAILVYSILNFFMTMFAIYFIEKMSRAVWSSNENGSKEAQRTTQMDREVSAGFYDRMMVDFDFKFVNFTRNIPRGSTSTIDS